MSFATTIYTFVYHLYHKSEELEALSLDYVLEVAYMMWFA